MSTNDLQLMSVAEIEAISQKNLENKQAQARGEPPPHAIPQEDLVRALRSIRALRSTGAQRPASKAAGTVATKEINLDDF
jgi:glutamyl-tRNA reductase